MCGITGIIYLNKERKIVPALLKSMSDAIYHRGPDDEGFYINRNVGLGFRRLSIIDLKAGHQPMANENDTIYIVFNGEIYNYLENRELLQKKGYVFKTNSDTEVIVHLYEEYGVDCLKYLRGMFAFAIWDNNKQQLFCARDRFGIKPFYYYQDVNKMVFGSEIKSILKSEEIDKSLSPEALDSYFAFGYITSDLSIYKNIRKLQPGHFMILSLKEKVKIEIKKYWKISFEPDYSKSEKQWVEEIEDCFSETVKLHMISDVPLGAFLSGGIDSSSVVAMMAKNSNLPIKTFSIGFKEQKYNELVFAREVAKRYNCEHHERVLEPQSISILPKLVSAYDEPFADSSAIPTYFVSQFAREYVTVALSGDGGDELFAGYNNYKYLKNINTYSSPFPKINSLIWGNIHKLIPQQIKGKGMTYFLSKDREYLGAFMCIWNQEERQKLIIHNGSEMKFTNASELYKKEILKKGIKNNFISNLQNLDLQTYLVDDILTKVDRASMMNSLEVRVPLLDHKFAELSFRIPWNLKYKGKTQKYIFKESIRTYLPKNVLTHQKQGFAIPLAMWFKDDLKEYIQETILSKNSLIASYIDRNYVKNIVRHNQYGMRDFSTRIWSLLVFEEWLNQNNQ